MTTPNPLEHEELFNVLKVTGIASPGTVTFSGLERVIGWDVKKGPGQSGATTERTSEDPAQFGASFYLATLEQIDAWPAFLALLKSSVAGPTPKALEVYHPDLAELDIKSIVLAGIGGTLHDGKGGQTKTVKLLEYRPPKPKGGSPKGSIVKKPKAPDPNQAALDELARLTDQYRNTPWG